MNITKEFLLRELEGLRIEQSRAQSQLDSLIGAVQAVQQLINALDQPEEPEGTEAGKEKDNES